MSVRQRSPGGRSTWPRRTACSTSGRSRSRSASARTPTRGRPSTARGAPPPERRRSACGVPEYDDLARRLARPKPVERVVEVHEREPAVDEPVDRQAALEEPLRVAREVERRDRGPVVGADDPARAIDEREALEPDGLPERRHPDEDGGPAGRQGGERLLD